MIYLSSQLQEGTLSLCGCIKFCFDLKLQSLWQGVSVLLQTWERASWQPGGLTLSSLGLGFCFILLRLLCSQHKRRGCTSHKLPDSRAESPLCVWGCVNMTRYSWLIVPLVMGFSRNSRNVHICLWQLSTGWTLYWEWYKQWKVRRCGLKKFALGRTQG